MRRICTAAALLFVAAACSRQRPTASPSPATPSPAPAASAAEPTPDGTSPPVGAATCGADRLELSLGGAEGAAGTTYVRLVATNTSADPCSLKGYPDVVVVDADNKELGSSADHDTVTPPKTLTLARGASAFATLAFPNPGNFEPGACTKEGAGLKVTLPGASTPLLLAARHASCPGFRVAAFSADWE